MYGFWTVWVRQYIYKCQNITTLWLLVCILGKVLENQILTSMFRNHLAIALRNLWRNKNTTFINILCLAIGLVTSILIFIFIQNELTYDRFHSDADRIYRVGVRGKFAGNEFDQAITAQPMAAALLNDYPEVEQVVRLRKYGDWLVTYGDRKYHEENFMFADSTFFEVFDFPLVLGDPHMVLDQPRSVVLTESTARKYFGEENPVGKMIKLERDTTLTRVTGVMKDVPGNSHIHFDMVGSLHTYARPQQEFWLNHNYYTYILLKEGTTGEQLEPRLNGILEKYAGPALEEVLGLTMEEVTSQGDYFGYHLQPLLSIHLNSNLDYEYESNGNKTLVNVFIVIAIMILIVACINFMNLATARSAMRAREVGIRKLLGARKSMLVLQFLGESVWLSFLAFVLATVVVALVFPVFTSMIKLEVSLSLFATWLTIPVVILFILFTGLIAGSYPAFFLASFRPVEVLKGTLSRGTRSGKLRSLLVVLQLGVSIFILAGTFVTFGQLKYLLSRDPGFDKENVLVIRRSDVLREQIESFKQELRKNSGVVEVSHSNTIPGRTFSNNVVYVEEQGVSATHMTWQGWVSDEFADSYDLKMKEGRFFSRDIPSDSFAVVINERAVKTLGLEEPVIGRRLMQPAGPREFNYLTIIGIMEDFHFQSMHQAIAPLRLNMIPGNWEGYIPVRISPENKQETLAFIRQTWEQFNQEYPFDYFWMDDDYNRLYQTEERISSVFISFAVISLLIAGLGLLGLISYTAVQRTREIGIRKAMGSSSRRIVYMFFRETTLLVLTGTLLATPIYFAIQSWLQNFAFHIPFNPGIFAGLILGAGFLTLILSLISVGGIAIRASRNNPAESLRYE